MKRHLAIASVLLFVTGCGTLEGGDADDTTDGLTKSDAAEKLEGGAIDYDPCEAYDWYDDGECDAFCPQSDPSCDDDSSACSQVITFGLHPDTGECHEFPTPCDVPDGWETSYSECPPEAPEEGTDENDTDENGGAPTSCSQVIAPAVDPDTGECHEFPTPCDVPDDWEIVDNCPDDSTAVGNEQDECQSHDDCTTGGCSGELCGHVDNPLASDCVWLPEYACYDDDVITTCGCFEGTCGWEQTDALDKCIDEKQ